MPFYSVKASSYLLWSDHVAQTFGHFLSINGPVRVCDDMLRQRKLGCHEECYPVDCVKSEDIFADNVVVRWPNRRQRACRSLFAKGVLLAEHVQRSD